MILPLLQAWLVLVKLVLVFLNQFLQKNFQVYFLFRHRQTKGSQEAVSVGFDFCQGFLTQSASNGS